MGKDLVPRQSSAIEPVGGKHHALPQSRAGWIITGATGAISFFFCLAAHFDGGSVLGGLFVTGIASGFSDDAVHALLYGRRFPMHLAMNNKPFGERFQEGLADFVYRWLGFERPDDPRDGFKARFARMCGMPEPDYDDEGEEGEPKDEKEPPDVIPLGPRSKRRQANDRMVNLADKLQLDIDDVAGKAIFICGIRRSGKTTLGVRVAEELGKFDIPMLIPCLKGDWLSCADTLPNARVWGQGQIEMKHARACGWAILERGMQLIFNIASYDDINKAFDILAEMIIGIFEWEKAHPEGKRLCAVFKDEAQTILPQVLGRSIITDPEVRNKLLGVYARVIAVGGSYGLFPVILTQRIAEVNKIIIGQPELLFLFKQTLDIDLQRYQEFTDVPTDQVRSLEQGHGIFVDYEGRSAIHKFHKRSSSDAMSSTPKYNPSPSLSPSPKTHRFS
ncbi:MAG TPA: hypothetical protein VHV10_06105, partial [Ktedonobacteraceae bacterium]|nr:hypothetical protein [Ktedonobacteraceae bacterium]